MKCEIEVSYLGDTVRIRKEDDSGSSAATSRAIALLDQTFQHMRSSLCAALDKRDLVKIPIIAIVPPEKIREVQEALNK